MSNPDTTEYFRPPNLACEGVVVALGRLNESLTAVSRGEGNEGDAFSNYMLADQISGLCGKLCVDGCTNDAFYAAQATDPSLERSTEQELLHDSVSFVLLDGALEELETDERPTVLIAELPNPDGALLRDIIESRLAIFEDPELLDRLSAHMDCEIEELQTMLNRHLTPRADDYYDSLAELVGGNIRAAQYLTSYFTGVHPLFRSSDPTMLAEAAAISRRGFTPANPFIISGLDLERIKPLIDDSGMVELPESSHSSVVFRMTDNPDDFIAYRQKDDGEIIDISSGWLPAKRGVIDVEIFKPEA